MGRGSIREIIFSSSERFEKGMLFLDIFINDNTRGINFFSQQTLKFRPISEEIILQLLNTIRLHERRNAKRTLVQNISSREAS